MAHRIFIPSAAGPPTTGYAPAPGTILEVLGPEAQHALRVKRLEVGDPLELTNGQGLVIHATVHETAKLRGAWVLRAKVERAELVARKTPQIHVLAAAPKGDRLEAMVDGLSQVGAASYAPLMTTRTIVDPSQHKLDRLRRHAEESLKQAGRAWVMEVGEGVEFACALARAKHTRLIVADATGEAQNVRTSDHRDITLLVGPEGGFTPEELAAAQAAGASILRCGVHTMRIEVAAVVACAMLMQP